MTRERHRAAAEDAVARAPRAAESPGVAMTRCEPLSGGTYNTLFRGFGSTPAMR